ncbi:YoaK family protein [Ancylobacter sp. G4_0304]|uniref:YoaK family protein n=1 Tax=Ancylobacter sp. G4_0304 TaxID=3114289 RepID=UPI0039C7043C
MALNRVPLLLSLNGGYVDTAGFLALHGLFTTHVTGNFVTFGASLAHGASGAVAKLLALPVFCLVVVLTQFLSVVMQKRGRRAFRLLLAVKALLLVGAAVLAIHCGPFPDGDAWQALVTGMILVSAMAMQNATHRLHLATAPPTTVMTMTVTQIMLDVGTLLHAAPDEKRAAAITRIRQMTPSAAAFALGCLAAAGLFIGTGMWVFVVPPILATVPALWTDTPG